MASSTCSVPGTDRSGFRVPWDQGKGNLKSWHVRYREHKNYFTSFIFLYLQLTQKNMSMSDPLIYKFFFNKYLHCFRSAVGIPQMQKADYRHWSIPFYLGDTSIHGFRYRAEGRVLDSIPCRYWGTAKFCGSQKLYTDFRLLGVLVPPTSTSFKSQLY